MLPKLLLVEDDPTIREVYEIKFEMEGYLVRSAEHGGQALEALAQFTPDIILLDMMMPVMGGLEFMQHFQALQCPAEVIVFSNISAPEQIQVMMELGAVDYWMKSDYTPGRAVDAIVQRWEARAKQKIRSRPMEDRDQV